MRPALFSLTLSYILVIGSSYLLPRHVYQTRLPLFDLKPQPAWLNRPNEEVIIKSTKPVEYSLFDRIHYDNSLGKHSLSSYSLREISESYSMPLAYLGKS